MDQEQYEKESRPRVAKINALFPMCGWGKFAPTRKELFIREEYVRVQAIQAQAEEGRF